MKRLEYFNITAFAVAILVLPLLLLASGCSAPNRSGAAPATASTPWDTPTPVSAPQPNSNGAMARANVQGTGVYVTKGVRQLTGSRWSFKTNDPETSTPAVHGSIVYYQSRKLYAVDASTGTEKWDRSLGIDGAISSPAVAGDTVYIGGLEELYALSAETGDTKWTFLAEHKSDNFLQDPIVVDGTVYFGGEGNVSSNFYALDSTTGQEKWKVKLSGTTGSVTTVYDGIVYIGTYNLDDLTDTYLYALDSKTGQERWKFKAPAKSRGIAGAVAVTGGVAYVSTYADGLLALDAKSGQEKWRYETGSSLGHAPAVAYETVYVREHGILYAVDAQTGKEKWRLQESDGSTSDPVIADGIVYFTSTEYNGGQPSGGLRAVDAQSGQKLWDFRAPAPGITEMDPAVADGTIYFASEEGTFYAVK
jgi:eukaryotic-like serine/threonine-protein kinase